MRGTFMFGHEKKMVQFYSNPKFGVGMNKCLVIGNWNAH
jgi:hypothetical protein